MGAVIRYFTCEECGSMFMAGKRTKSVMICGDGCGGTVIELTEAEMNSAIEEKRNGTKKFRR